MVIRRAAKKNYIAIIIDPIYKIITGDENSADQMAAFCNQFDLVCTELGCAVIYCHHHSKGSQGQKRSMDRASGSGVFARDADAIIDFTNLVLDPNQKELALQLRGNTGTGDLIPLQLEMVLRSFRSPAPVNMFFEFPLHLIDQDHILDGAAVEGTAEANRKLAPNNQKSNSDKKAIVDACFDAVTNDGISAKFSSMYKCDECSVSDATLKKYVLLFPDFYCLEDGIVRKV